MLKCAKNLLCILTICPIKHSDLCFLPRDDVRKRGLCCRPVSVCPSVTMLTLETELLTVLTANVNKRFTQISMEDGNGPWKKPLHFAGNPDGNGIVSTQLKISSNFFLGPVAHHSSFYKSPAQFPIPRGTPSAGAQIRGWGNFAIFDSNPHFSRKRYEIGPWLLCTFNRKS